MTILAIILLVLFGVLLVLLEFFVVPGVTIAGVGGLILMGGGVYLSYDVYGAEVGHYFLAGTLMISSILIYFALRSDTWSRMGLKSTITGKTNTHDKEDFHVGDSGIALTRLAPMGVVEINGKSIEAKSTGKFIDQQTEIIVVEVLRNKLVVKSKK